MTNTEVAIIDDAELDAFASQAGVNEEDLSGATDYLPQLKVNYQEENPTTKKELKKGTFFLTGKDKAVYAKNVVFRPLLQDFQWTEWNKEQKKTVARTVFIKNFGEEARDDKGTVRCGKPTSKEIKERTKTNPKYPELFEGIKCYRTVHGLVSYVGTDEDGVEYTIENELCVLRLKGANFNPFKDEYLDNLPKGSRLWDYDLNLGTTREKNDPSSATYFYVVHYDADFTNRKVMTADVFDMVKSADARVKEFNVEIEAAYIKALTDTKTSGEAMDAIDEALDIPFELDNE